MSIYVKPWVSAAAKEVISSMNSKLQSVPPAIRQEFFRHCPKFGPVIEAAISKHAPEEVAPVEQRQSMAEAVREAVKNITPEPAVNTELVAPLLDALRAALKSANLRANQLAIRVKAPEADVLKCLNANPDLFELGAKGWWKGR